MSLSLPSDDLRQSEQELLARVSAGDTVAFNALLRRYLGELVHFAFRYVHSRDAAEDIVQDVMCRVWDTRASLQVQGSVRAYLFAAVRFRALNSLRDAKALSVREARYAQHDSVASATYAPPAEHIEHLELNEAVQAAIEQLPPRRREILRLRGQQFSYAEIAAILQISVKTVEAQITSAYAQLCQALRPWIT